MTVLTDVDAFIALLPPDIPGPRVFEADTEDEYGEPTAADLVWLKGQEWHAMVAFEKEDGEGEFGYCYRVDGKSRAGKFDGKIATGLPPDLEDYLRRMHAVPCPASPTTADSVTASSPLP